MQYYLIVWAGILASFPAWEKAEVFALVSRTNSKELQTKCLESKNSLENDTVIFSWNCSISPCSCMVGTLLHPVLGEPLGTVLQAGTEKQESGKRDHGQLMSHSQV